jgi:hypothetical protein
MQFRWMTNTNQGAVMRRLILAGLVSSVGLSAALASGSQVSVPGLNPLPQAVPPQCEPLASIPSSTEIATPILASRVSVANCMAEAALNGVAAAPDQAGVQCLDTALGPSLAILDNVSQVGDPYWKVIAEDAKRDIYVSMIVRERVSLKGDVAAHDELEARLAPWHAGAAKSTAAIASTVKANPRLGENDPVVAAIVTRLSGQQTAMCPAARSAECSL